MIVDRAFEDYDNVALISDEWPHKHLCKLESGLKIIKVLNEIHNY